MHWVSLRFWRLRIAHARHHNEHSVLDWIKQEEMEIRDEPEQNEIRSVTVTHQFNANIARGKKPKVGGKKLR